MALSTSTNIPPSALAPASGGLARSAALTKLRPAVQEAILRLGDYLRAHDFAGYDPYDGLESTLFQRLPFRHSKWARLLIIHFNKRSPVNFRPLLGVPRGRNPKGIALCASAFLRLRDRQDNLETARQLLSWLLDHQAEGFAGASWGYNFDWQSRTFFAPKGSPNAVCTIFAGNAFLDAFEACGDAAYRDVARAACEFLLETLLVRQGSDLHFRYIPARDTEIHNVNLLTAALLARTGRLTGESQLADVSRQAIEHSVARQRPDGSWPYGEDANQRWIDNYHTGFNLVALSRYRTYTADERFADATRRGYEFWDQNFFLPDGAPKFYATGAFPIDIHCVAQALLTYTEFAAADPAAGDKLARTLQWAFAHMWSPAGYFYFQRQRWYSIRISYARWAQAWMLYALSALAGALDGGS